MGRQSGVAVRGLRGPCLAGFSRLCGLHLPSVAPPITTGTGSSSVNNVMFWKYNWKIQVKKHTRTTGVECKPFFFTLPTSPNTLLVSDDSFGHIVMYIPLTFILRLARLYNIWCFERLHLSHGAGLFSDLRARIRL